MTESNLTLAYDDLRKAIGLYLGYGTTTANWSTKQAEQIAYCLTAGLRQFYSCPPVVINNMEYHHKWSFLTPVAELTLAIAYSTGTITIANGSTTVTLSSGTWPSWAATHGTLVVDSTDYEISSRDSDTQLTLSSAWSEDSISGEEYTLERDAKYDLPDDFGIITKYEIVFDPPDGQPNIKIVPQTRILDAWSHDYGAGRPRYATIQPKTLDATTGQRWEIWFDIKADDTYVLKYSYKVLPNAIDGTSIYHYGGSIHSETMKESCLAMAELHIKNAVSTVHKAEFFEKLKQSVMADLNQGGHYIGEVSDGVPEENYYRVQRTATYTPTED